MIHQNRVKFTEMQQKKLSQKAEIKTIQDHKMAEKVEALIKEYENIKKLNEADKTEGNPKIVAFRLQLEETMAFWPKNIIQEMEVLRDRPNILQDEENAIQEDINFLHSMQTDRKACYTGRDKRYEKLITARQNRRGPQPGSSRGNTQSNSSDETIDTTSSDVEENAFEGTESSPVKRKHRRTKSGVDVHIPPDILKNELIQSTAIRNKITPTALSAVMHSIVSVCNKGDTSGVYLHHTQAYRLAIYMYLYHYPYQS